MNMKSIVAIIISVALMGLVAYTAVRAQSSTSFGLYWNVIADGGERSQSNSFVLNGTFGQSVAGPPESNSASYTVTGGYWSGIVSAQIPVSTSTPTLTLTPTPTSTSSPTLTPTPTSSPTLTPTPTSSPTLTPTPTPDRVYLPNVSR